MEEQAAMTSRKPARVLLAEDNAINRAVALNVLQRLGLRADAVVNGAEAVHALEKTDYDLVLMDMEMPIMDGRQATRAIREAGRRLPVIALTAHTLSGDIFLCKEDGIDDYIAKPISPEILAAMLGKWLPKGSFPQSRAPVETAAQVPPARRAVAGRIVFDKAGLLARVLQDGEFARSIIAVFLEELPRQLALLEKSAGAGTLSEAARQAHTIKGAAGSIGGCAMRDKAGEVESAAKAGDLETTKRLVGELEDHFALLAEIMNEDFGA